MIMKVSLRKANALQEQLNEAIKTRPNADHEVNVIDYEPWKSDERECPDQILQRSGE